MARIQLKDFAVGEQSKFVKARLARKMNTSAIVADAAKHGYALTPGSVAAVKAHTTRETADRTYKPPSARVAQSTDAEAICIRKPRGPRDIYFVCLTLIGKSIIAEEILARHAVEAIEAFKAKHGSHLDVTVMNGCGYGYYHVQGTGMVHDHTEVVSVELADIFPNGKNFKARYTWKGVVWNVNAIGLCACKSNDGRLFDDGELFILNWISTVDGKKADKPKLKKFEAVQRSRLTHLVKR
jgi:hypothetical protein